MLNHRTWCWIGLGLLFAIPSFAFAGKPTRKLPTTHQKARYSKTLQYNRAISKKLRLLIRQQESFTRKGREQKAYLLFRLGAVHYNSAILSTWIIRWCKAHPKQRCPVRPHHPTLYRKEGIQFFERVWNRYPQFTQRHTIKTILIRYYLRTGNHKKAKQFQQAS
ncbi:MAG: hypothetical protein EP343_23055 [Deltaproteobacteria bacterium]|nr:MAG: hypothetical protein EP343_23055 [Deltaproteobacteria bacterium]